MDPLVSSSPAYAEPSDVGFSYSLMRPWMSFLAYQAITAVISRVRATSTAKMAVLVADYLVMPALKSFKPTEYRLQPRKTYITKTTE